MGRHISIFSWVLALIFSLPILAQEGAEGDAFLEQAFQHLGHTNGMPHYRRLQFAVWLMRDDHYKDGNLVQLEIELTPGFEQVFGDKKIELEGYERDRDHQIPSRKKIKLGNGTIIEINPRHDTVDVAIFPPEARSTTFPRENAIFEAIFSRRSKKLESIGYSMRSGWDWRTDEWTTLTHNGKVERSFRSQTVSSKISPTTNAKVKVAMIGYGLNYNVPELASRIVGLSDESLTALGLKPDAFPVSSERRVGFNFVDVSPYPYAMDGFLTGDWGTQIASLLVAGTKDIALLPLKTSNDEHVARAISTALREGAKIIYLEDSFKLSEAKQINELVNANPEVLFVVPAGTDGNDLHEVPIYPAALGARNVLVVGTVSAKTGELTRNANFSPRFIQIGVIDSQRPAYMPSGELKRDSSNHIYFPSAWAARIAALLMRERPDLNPAGLIQILQASATKVSSLTGAIQDGNVLDESAAFRKIGLEFAPTDLSIVPVVVSEPIVHRPSVRPCASGLKSVASAAANATFNASMKGGDLLERMASLWRRRR